MPLCLGRMMVGDPRKLQKWQLRTKEASLRPTSLTHWFRHIPDTECHTLCQPGFNSPQECPFRATDKGSILLRPLRTPGTGQRT